MTENEQIDVVLNALKNNSQVRSVLAGLLKTRNATVFLTKLINDGIIRNRNGDMTRYELDVLGKEILAVGTKSEYDERQELLALGNSINQQNEEKRNNKAEAANDIQIKNKNTSYVQIIIGIMAILLTIYFGCQSISSAKDKKAAGRLPQPNTNQKAYTLGVDSNKQKNQK